MSLRPNSAKTTDDIPVGLAACYNETLSQLSALPADAAYAESTIAITQERLAAVEGGAADEAVAGLYDCESLDEVLSLPPPPPPPPAAVAACRRRLHLPPARSPPPHSRRTAAAAAAAARGSPVQARQRVASAQNNRAVALFCCWAGLPSHPRLRYSPFSSCWIHSPAALRRMISRPCSQRAWPRS